MEITKYLQLHGLLLELKKKDTWRWFMWILQDDLQLGDGTQVTMISNMQKVSVAKEVFPAYENRIYARHILIHWSKKWRGIERRKKFWSCVRETFEAKLKTKLDELNTLRHNIVEFHITKKDGAKSTSKNSPNVTVWTIICRKVSMLGYW